MFFFFFATGAVFTSPSCRPFPTNPPFPLYDLCSSSRQGHLCLHRSVYSVPPSQLLSLSSAESEWLSQVSSVRHPQPLHFPASSQPLQSFSLSVASPVSIRPRTPLHRRSSFPASNRFSPPNAAHVSSSLFSDAKIIGADCGLLSGPGAGSLLSSVPRRHPSSPRGLHSQSSRVVAPDALCGCRVLSPSHCLPPVPLPSSFPQSSSCRVSLLFPTRCSPRLLCAAFHLCFTTLVSWGCSRLSRRIWLTSLLLQQAVNQGLCDGDGVNCDVNDGKNSEVSCKSNSNSNTEPCNEPPLESSLRLCHTRNDTITTLTPLSLSRESTVRVALHTCSEDSGPFIDASLIELIRHIDPVQSVVEVTREAGCVIELMTPQQRRAFYWLIRVLEESSSLIPFCACEVTDEEQVVSRTLLNHRSHSLSFSPSVCDTRRFSSLHECPHHTPCHLTTRSTDCIHSSMNRLPPPA